MKAVHKLGIVLFGLCLLAGCFFKPQITKDNKIMWPLELLGTMMFKRLSLLVLQKMRAREVIF